MALHAFTPLRERDRSSIHSASTAAPVWWAAVGYHRKACQLHARNFESCCYDKQCPAVVKMLQGDLRYGMPLRFVPAEHGLASFSADIPEFVDIFFLSRCLFFFFFFYGETFCSLPARFPTGIDTFCLLAFEQADGLMRHITSRDSGGEYVTRRIDVLVPH